MTANDNVYSTGYSNCFQVVSVLIVYGGNTTFFLNLDKTAVIETRSN